VPHRVGQGVVEEEPTTSDGLRGLRAGSRLGHYRLKRLLGNGAFGHVWEADDTVMDRVIAPKLLRSAYSENEKFRHRLFREAHAAGRLHEPHVVPILQCGEIDGQLFIDMRLIDGTDLEAVLSQEGTLAPARAASL
jgi:serine/threonine protein kinase